MGTDNNVAAPAAPARRNRRPTAPDDLSGRVAYAEAIQETHEARILHVEGEAAQQRELMTGVMRSTTNVANQLTGLLDQVADMKQESVLVKTWVQDSQARQPARDQKDIDDSAALAELVTEAKARQEREHALADQLARTKKEQEARDRRLTRLLKGLGGAFALLIVALAPSSVGQLPPEDRPYAYGVYVAVLLGAIVLAVVLSSRDDAGNDGRDGDPGH